MSSGPAIPCGQLAVSAVYGLVLALSLQAVLVDWV